MHSKLCDETRYWFLARRQVSPQLLFYDYFIEAVINIRKVLGLIIYWPGQSHNGGARDLPSKADFLDIVQSIIGDDYIFVV